MTTSSGDGMHVELHYFDDCPNWRTTEARLRALQAEYGFDLELRHIATDDEARRVGFRGSPTILVDGEDPFPGAAPIEHLACRVFSTPTGLAGIPSDDQLRQAIDA